MGNILEVKNLVKNYEDIIAVDDISFTVKEGSFFAFLGPNGAGKSTTINIICTLLSKTSGEVLVDGYKVGNDDFQIRELIGVVFQESVLDKLLTVEENLRVRGSFYNIDNDELSERIEEISNIIEIKDFLNQRYGKLSGGQRRRADIARALVNRPKFLILDEPTTGLDPYSRKTVWKIIKKLKEEHNITIFLTTHYMEETIDADKIVIIDEGKIVANDTPEQLKLKYSYDILKIVPYNIEDLKCKLDSLEIEFVVKVDTFIIKLKNSKDSITILYEIKDLIEAFEVVRGNMDDVFINITGKAIKKG